MGFKIYPEVSSNTTLQIGYNPPFSGSVWARGVNGVPTSLTNGFTMAPRGYVRGYGITVNCTAVTGAGDVVYTLYKNGNSFHTATMTITATGVQSLRGGDPLGSSTYAAGDILSMQAVFDTFTGTLDDLFVIYVLACYCG